MGRAVLGQLQKVVDAVAVHIPNSLLPIASFSSIGAAVASLLESICPILDEHLACEVRLVFCYRCPLVVDLR